MIYKGDSAMFPLFRNFLMFAVAGAIIALSAAAHSPYAETLAFEEQHELSTFGIKEGTGH
jgi:hypothetical protein